MQVVLTEQMKEKIIELRHELHRHPELSGQEIWTKQHLMEFLNKNTSLEIHDMDSWFYAVKYRKQKAAPDENSTEKSSALKENQAEATAASENGIAFRADFDALPIDEELDISYCSEVQGVSHKCGHDGHSAALCGLALLLDVMETERDVYLFFQPAEEIGMGGEVCAEYLSKLPISEVYAWHNRDGLAQQVIYTKEGSIQCASKGLTILFSGKKSHASEPEKGINPAFAIADFIDRLVRYPMEQFKSRTQFTIVNVQVGTKDFGVSPGAGEISLTLRADRQSDLECLENMLREETRIIAEAESLQVQYEINDPFPETANAKECVERIVKTAENLGIRCEILDSPWRASEDFGYYTMKKTGAMFFVGNGEEQPPLHTKEYDFNDEILETAIQMMAGLILL